MTGLNETVEYPKCTERNMRPCETPGCSENCAYAFSCYEQRMGRSPAAFWPAIGLGLIAVLAIFV